MSSWIFFFGTVCFHGKLNHLTARQQMDFLLWVCRFAARAYQILYVKRRISRVKWLDYSRTWIVQTAFSLANFVRTRSLWIFIKQTPLTQPLRLRFRMSMLAIVIKQIEKISNAYYGRRDLDRLIWENACWNSMTTFHSLFQTYWNGVKCCTWKICIERTTAMDGEKKLLKWEFHNGILQTKIHSW